MPSDLKKRLYDIIEQQLGANREQITPESRFIEDLGADSLDTIELCMAVEEEFAIDLPDEKAEKMTTVQDALNYLEENAE